MPKHWLFKSEPSDFSIEDLARSEQQTTGWDGVRNYTARNLLRDEIKRGDLVLFYHSSTDPTAVVGLAKVVRDGYPDPTQFDRKSAHHDAGSEPANPRWYQVDIKLETIFARPLTLEELKGTPGLEKMMLLQRGSRLSVQPVTPEEFAIVKKLAGAAKRADKKSG